MAPRPASSGSAAERPYHGANGKAVVAAKVSGTPRREQSHRHDKAVQDPGLKDYVGLDSFLVGPFPQSRLLLCSRASSLIVPCQPLSFAVPIGELAFASGGIEVPLHGPFLHYTSACLLGMRQGCRFFVSMEQ